MLAPAAIFFVIYYDIVIAGMNFNSFLYIEVILSNFCAYIVYSSQNRPESITYLQLFFICALQHK